MRRFSAFLVRYGDPQIGEPLSHACRRVSESGAWRDSRLRFGLLKETFAPHERGSVFLVGACLRHVVVATFPGADEKEKLNRVFASAPPWLVYFTFADLTAKILELSSPDLSSVIGFVRSKANLDLWYGLPAGSFERNPWPNDSKKRLACTDLDLVRSGTQWRERPAASQAVKRARNWPVLLSAKVLEMRPEELLKHIQQSSS